MCWLGHVSWFTGTGVAVRYDQYGFVGAVSHFGDAHSVGAREGRKVEEGCISPFCVCLLLQFSFIASFKIIPLLT